MANGLETKFENVHHFLSNATTKFEYYRNN